jgi:hypothetical protein
MRATKSKPLNRAKWMLVPAVLALGVVPLLFAQSSPKVASIDPMSGKVNDTLTLTGENLDKDNVVGVFLSDDKDDTKADVVQQAAAKIVVKVPQVKAGSYNVSVQVKDRILILPIKFSVTQ